MVVYVKLIGDLNKKSHCCNTRTITMLFISPILIVHKQLHTKFGKPLPAKRKHPLSLIFSLLELVLLVCQTYFLCADIIDS